MDVYVVNLNGAVIGAGADFDSAAEIADRGEHQLNHHPWAEWRHEPDTGKWWRNAMGLQVQTITRVPLAGLNALPVERPDQPGGPSLAYAFNRGEIEEIGRQFGAP